MAKNSESIEERMERKREAFVKRVTESKEAIKEHRESFEERSNANDLSIKVDIDVSDALKGLKAVQREAKNAARALREVEELTNGRNVDSEDIVTHALYSCLICGHKEKVRGKKEDYMEVRVCPKCKGAFVDIWKMEKYTTH